MTKNNEIYNYRTTVDDDNKETEITHIKSVPTNYIMSMVSKVAKNVKNPLLNEDQSLNIKVDNNDTKVLLSLINAVADTHISHYDLTVHNAVCTLYYEGNKEITPKQIAKKIIGKNVKIRKHHTDSITASVTKMKKTLIAIDHREQFINWNKEKEAGSDYYISDKFDSMLNIVIERGRYLNNNKVEFTFHIKETPPILDYSILYKQIANTKDELIDTSGYLTKYDETTIALRSYLVERIEGFKSQRAANKKINTFDISYKTMYESVGKSELIEGRSEYRNRFLKNVNSILDAFKNNGWIKSYSHSGNTINGKVTIGKILHDDKYI